MVYRSILYYISHVLGFKMMCGKFTQGSSSTLNFPRLANVESTLETKNDSRASSITMQVCRVVLVKRIGLVDLIEVSS